MTRNRDITITGSTPAFAQASTFSALKWPVSASRFSAFAHLLGQVFDLLRHRFDLVLVAGPCTTSLADHQTARHHRRPRVVELFEAAAGHRHDGRLFVGQIDLIVRRRPVDRQLRRPAARSSPVASILASRAAILASLSRAHGAHV
jgi:hypothetical protein